MNLYSMLLVDPRPEEFPAGVRESCEKKLHYAIYQGARKRKRRLAGPILITETWLDYYDPLSLQQVRGTQLYAEATLDYYGSWDRKRRSDRC